MSDCCLTNLGCLQIPTSVISTVGQNGQNGADGQDGATGATGPQGPAGFVRVAHNVSPILSGVGSPKTFITRPVSATYMPQNEGSSLLLTFNVRTDTYPLIRDALKSRLIGVRFGGQECIIGVDNNNLLPVSVGKMETQFKVEIIRTSNPTQAYARVSIYGIDFTENAAICHNESNLLTGLNFFNQNDFVIYGFQNDTNTFIFSTLTVDKITAL